jgi:hypothetical protein
MTPPQKANKRLRAIEALLAPWLLRGAFALLLFAAWELLLGKAVFARDIIDLMALVIGCIAAAALLLDLIERFSVRDMFGALVVMGVGGLFSFLLFDMRPPEDVFLALASRGLGAYTLFALVLFTSLVWLTRAGEWRALLALLPIGIITGVWARWMPYENAPTPDGWLLLIVAGLLWVTAAQLTRTGAAMPGTRLRLSFPEALAAAGLLIIGVSARTDARLPNALTAVVAATLVVLCILMLWFQRRQREESYAEQLLHWHPQAARWGIALPIRVGAWLFVIGIGALVGWLLPRGEGAGDPVAIVGTLFTAFGLVWLPTVAVVYGWRAMRRDLRALRL